MADSKYTESGGRLKKAVPLLIRLRNIFVSSACVGLLFFGLAWGAHFFLRYLKYEITNDAYIDQYVVPLSVRVSGNIKEVRFREHMKVKKGELLLTIDDREFKMRVASAKAALERPKPTRKCSSRTSRAPNTTWRRRRLALRRPRCGTSTFSETPRDSGS